MHASKPGILEFPQHRRNQQFDDVSAAKIKRQHALSNRGSVIEPTVVQPFTAMWA
jgi:hypothetical protein